MWLYFDWNIYCDWKKNSVQKYSATIPSNVPQSQDWYVVSVVELKQISNVQNDYFDIQSKTSRLDLAEKNQIPPNSISSVKFDSQATLLKRITRIEAADLKFQEIVGSGSFGQVWKGEWQSTEVAIKQIKQNALNADNCRNFFFLKCCHSMLANKKSVTHDLSPQL